MLNKDISLFFESISMAEGHAGSRTRYQAATREVIHAHWFTIKEEPQPPFQEPRYESRNEEERLPIPESITTEDQLRRYVCRHRIGWIRDGNILENLRARARGEDAFSEDPDLDATIPPSLYAEP